MKNMQNKQLVIALGVVLLVIILGVGGFLVLGSRNKSASVAKNAPNFVSSQDAPVATIAPEALGFTLAMATTGQSAGHAIDVTVSNLTGLKSIDYEFTYMYSGDLNQGGFGHFDIKSGQSNVKQEIILGTCSSGVCRYDANPSHFKITLDITKTDGKSYSSEKEMDL